MEKLLKTDLEKRRDKIIGEIDPTLSWCAMLNQYFPMEESMACKHNKRRDGNACTNCHDCKLFEMYFPVGSMYDRVTRKIVKFSS